MGKIPFVRDSFRGQVPINWYPVKDDEKGYILRATPGLERKATIGKYPVRGLRVVGNTLYMVAGNGFYSVGSDYYPTLIGTIAGTSIAPVMMEDNGLEILIVIPGEIAYIYTIASGSFAWVDLGFIASSITCQDGYFIAGKKDAAQFYISELYDGDSWDALDYATPEGRADNLVRVFSDHRELWLFGKTTTEIWYNSGSSFPFTRVGGGFVELGCAASGTVAQMDNSIVWLSNLGQLVRAESYTPKIISSRKLEREWSGYSTLSDAQAFAYLFEGHWFYHLIFPTAEKVWVYDAATDLWHERRSYLNDGPHRAACYALYNGAHIVGDYNDGYLFEMSSSVYEDNSQTITRVIETEGVNADGKNLFFPELQVEFEAGYADQEGQGSDPQAMLQWSEDGGGTWGNEHWVSVGKVGEYGRRAIWRRMGKSRDRVFRLTITDPVLSTIVAWDLKNVAAGR